MAWAKSSTCAREPRDKVIEVGKAERRASHAEVASAVTSRVVGGRLERATVRAMGRDDVVGDMGGVRRVASYVAQCTVWLCSGSEPSDWAPSSPKVSAAAVVGQRVILVLTGLPYESWRKGDIDSSVSAGYGAIVAPAVLRSGGRAL